MNNVFFKDGFLTSTEAQNICNVANEIIARLTEHLNSVQFYNTSITSIVSSDNEIHAGIGIRNVSWIQDEIVTIGQYNSLIAWLKEAIKIRKKHLVNYQVHVFKIGQSMNIILLLNLQVKKLQ